MTGIDRARFADFFTAAAHGSPHLDVLSELVERLVVLEEIAGADGDAEEAARSLVLRLGGVLVSLAQVDQLLDGRDGLDVERREALHDEAYATATAVVAVFADAFPLIAALLGEGSPADAAFGDRATGHPDQEPAT